MVCQVSTSLISLGFVQSKSDFSLFVKGSSATFLALLVYVDDIIITGTSLDNIETLKGVLHNIFKLKDLGSLKFFLGLELARSSSGICISQRHYTLQLLVDHDLLGCKPAFVPLDPTLKLRASNCDLLTDISVY